jgi:hypothetical protein
MDLSSDRLHNDKSLSQDNSVLSKHLLAILMLNMNTSIVSPYSNFTVIHNYDSCVLLAADQIYIIFKVIFHIFSASGTAISWCRNVFISYSRILIITNHVFLTNKNNCEAFPCVCAQCAVSCGQQNCYTEPE